jgi:hypothetical protein
VFGADWTENSTPFNKEANGDMATSKDATLLVKRAEGGDLKRMIELGERHL